MLNSIKCGAWALSFALMTFGAAGAQTTDWPTFGGSAQRQGFNPSETTLSQANVGQLTLQWSQEIAGVGTVGAIGNQPVLAHNVMVNGMAHSVVYIGSNAGMMTALDAVSGAILWQVNTPVFTFLAGSECAGRHAGITQAATLDIPNNRMFFADGLEQLHELNMKTGAEIAPYPIQVVDAANQPPHTHIHSGLTLVGSQLYLVTSSPCNDQAPYEGEAISVNVNTATVTQRYFPLGNVPGVYGAGTWAQGGIALGGDGQSLYMGTGNGKAPDRNVDPNESVMKLDRNLNVLASHSPIKSKGGDFDMSATPLLFTVPNCPERLAILAKSGQLFLYDPTNIGSGPLQTFQVGTPSGAALLYSVPAFDPQTNAIYFGSGSNSPDGTYSRGLLAFHANASCTLTPYWNKALGIGPVVNANNIPRPATVANGVVYLGFTFGVQNQLAAFADTTGAELWNSGTLFPNSPTNGSHAPEPGPPLVANGMVYVTTANHIWAFSLPAQQQRH